MMQPIFIDAKSKWPAVTFGVARNAIKKPTRESSQRIVAPRRLADYPVAGADPDREMRT
jgi:hypothetical protein